MSVSPDLPRLQSLFWQLITAPEGVARGLEELRGRGELGGAELSALVRERGELGAVARLDIYADMYFYRLRDCLAEDFPALAAELGAAHFHNLVTDYLLAHPPAHFSLRELGRALPDFVANHARASQHPALADLARLEWARVDVFDEADAEPLSREELMQAAADGPERRLFAAIPASRLLRLAPQALELWRRHRAETSAGPQAGAAPGGEAPGVLVWRRDFGVFHRSLAADEERCLEALERGPVSVAELGERVLASQPEDGEPAGAAARLAGLLERWAADRLLTRSAGP